jgi:hypothetical protein
MFTELTRRDWCHEHLRGPRGGRLSAVFQPGHTMRCPLVRTRANGHGMTCGGNLGRVPLSAAKAVVRGPVGLAPIDGSKHERRTCDSCHKMLDVYLLPVPVQLEATG